MENKETEEAINYLQRVIKVSKETAYDLFYRDIDIKCLEIALDYIEELEKNKIDKEITIRFTDGREAKVVKIENLDTQKHIDKLSARIIELEKLPNKIRDKIKELDETKQYWTEEVKEILEDILGEGK